MSERLICLESLVRVGLAQSNACLLTVKEIAQGLSSELGTEVIKDFCVQIIRVRNVEWENLGPAAVGSELDEIAELIGCLQL
jgi:hypothetical protein